ncbi:MAG: 4-phosphoerythronate dehydrogenase PdxB [Planctomycetes bacterium]|nr:4-phosphoerythronate dehydrogenase PdxB [Planctomycetota bacterium]
MKIIADANIPFVAECFSSIGEVITVGGREITPGVVGDADVLLVRSITQVNADLLSGSKVRFVATATIGFDHVDIDFLKRNHIGFTSAPGSNANSAAEYVVAGLLEASQKCDINLEGKSIGIIGVGNVGNRVAKKCAALGMRIYLNDPPLQRQTGEAKYLPLQELYDCDFITFHTPLTFESIDKTYHLADERFFKSLNKRCVFVNASRGGVVDSEALKTVIRPGRLKAVVLDVWENEPNIDMELLEMVDIGTPHIAGYSLDGKISGMIMIYKAACEYFGLSPKYGIEDFLPEPVVRQLRIEPSIDNEQAVLLEAVRKIYDIREDDNRLRQVSEKPVEKRGGYFDGLRKNYPIRREFQNTKVFVENGNGALAKKLKGIGFKTSEK